MLPRINAAWSGRTSIGSTLTVFLNMSDSFMRSLRTWRSTAVQLIESRAGNVPFTRTVARRAGKRTRTAGFQVRHAAVAPGTARLTGHRLRIGHQQISAGTGFLRPVA